MEDSCVEDQWELAVGLLVKKKVSKEIVFSGKFRFSPESPPACSLVSVFRYEQLEDMGVED